MLKQEVLQLKEQLASLAEPRDVDTINRMNPNERKKMEKSAGKIGVNLKGGKSSNKKDAPSKGNTRGRSKGKSKGKGSKKGKGTVNTVANSKKSDKANAVIEQTCCSRKCDHTIGQCQSERL